MRRRYLDHIHAEICLALDRRVSRYDLWLALWDLGGDPDDLSPEQARRFVETGLDPLLREEGIRLGRWARRRLARRILRFDPRFPTPEERLASRPVAATAPARRRRRSSRPSRDPNQPSCRRAISSR